MTKPFLLAETPRAGDMNHRFICSPAADITGEVASGLCGDVRLAAGDTRTRVYGTDYVAVIQRGVFQVRSDRRGDEILILGGVDPSRVNLAAAADRLAARLPTLGGIAADVANRPGILVEHDDLGVWLEEAVGSPRGGVRGGVAQPSGSSTLPGRKVAIYATLIVALVAAAYFARPYVAALFAHKSDPTPNPDTPGHVPQIEGSTSTAPTIDDLAKTLGLAADPAAHKELEERVKDTAKIPELIRQVSEKKIDPYALLKDAPVGRPNLGKLDPGDAIALRTTLWGCGKFLVRLRDAVREAKLHETNAAKLEKTPTLALLAALGRSKDFDIGQSATTLQKLPWFNESDAATAIAMIKLFNVFLETPGGQEFARVRLGGVPSSLPGLLAAIHDNAAKIEDSLRPELRAFARTKEEYNLLIETLNPPLASFTDYMKRENSRPPLPNPP